MAPPEYRCTPARFARECRFKLRGERLEWECGGRRGHVPYADVASLDICKERFLGSSATYWRCILYPAAGRPIRISAASRNGLTRIEDLTASYIPFIKELEARIAAANPNRMVWAGTTWLSRFEDAAARLAVLALRAIRHIAPDRCADAAAWTLRRIGPKLRGHRTARSQLALAFPEKSAAEIEHILGGMWDNIARCLVEYAMLDRLWDHDLVSGGGGRILVDQASS